MSCDEGYSTNAATATCNGFQFTNLPVCEAGACTSANVPNSNYASTSLSGSTGDSFNVICSEGYEGGGISTCQTNGQFSSVQCTKIQCTDVTIARATPSPVSGESFTSYDVTCDEGYHVNGESETVRTQTTTCQSTGQFTALQTCVPNTCSSFSHANSNRESPVVGLTTGEELSVTCNTGYTNNGNVIVQTATCQTSGTFNTLSACAANTCQSASLSNSNRHSSNPIVGLTTGENVIVSCNTGYTSDGTVTDQTATCQTNGLISSLNPCNANTCTQESISNAVGTPFAGYTTGDVVSVVCESGFYGGGDMTCDSSGSFTNVPSCNQILCSEPNVLYGAYDSSLWSSDVEDGASIDLDHITCDSGFSKRNDAISCECSTNGEPCATLLTVCYANGCSPPSVLNGQFDTSEWTAQASNGQNLTTSLISCDSGYSRTSTTDFTCECLIDGNACSTLQNACEENQCESLDVSNGALSATCAGGGATSEPSCTFACASGYSMSGTNPIVCAPTGTWPAYPTCNENVCEEISVVASGTTAGASCSQSGASTSPECTFACLDGYTLSGDATISCDYDGNWETYPTCVAQSCTSMNILNSDYSSTNSISGNTDEIRVVTCDDGYTENTPSRVQTLKCDGSTMTFRRVLTDGSLADVLECVPNTCTPTFHPNSNASQAGSIVGTTGDAVTVTCDVGYTNDGDTTTIQTTCDGQSFSALEECVPNTCLSTEVENSEDYSADDSINGATGDSFDVVCAQGYSGGGIATCGTFFLSLSAIYARDTNNSSSQVSTERSTLLLVNPIPVKVILSSTQTTVHLIQSMVRLEMYSILNVTISSLFRVVLR